MRFLALVIRFSFLLSLRCAIFSVVLFSSCERNPAKNVHVKKAIVTKKQKKKKADVAPSLLAKAIYCSQMHCKRVERARWLHKFYRVFILVRALNYG